MISHTHTHTHTHARTHTRTHTHTHAHTHTHCFSILAFSNRTTSARVSSAVQQPVACGRPPHRRQRPHAKERHAAACKHDVFVSRSARTQARQAAALCPYTFGASVRAPAGVCLHRAGVPAPALRKRNVSVPVEEAGVTAPWSRLCHRWCHGRSTLLLL